MSNNNTRVFFEKVQNTYKVGGFGELYRRALTHLEVWPMVPFIYMLSKFINDPEISYVDLKNSIIDVKHTRDIRKKINGFKSRGLNKTIDDLKLNEYKKSDKLFILGSGNSVNDLTDENWEYISKHDSLGINHWMMHDFVPTYYFFEPCIDEDLHIHFTGLLDQNKEKYINTPFICDYKYWNSAGKDFTDFPEEIRRNLYLMAANFLKVKSSVLIELFLNYLYPLFARPYNFDSIVKYRSSISVALSFGLISGYKELILIGVDLADTQYFWETSDIYAKRELPRNILKCKVHDSADVDYSKVIGVISIDKLIDIFHNAILAPRGIKLSVGSTKSKLYPKYQLYDFNVQKFQ